MRYCVTMSRVIHQSAQVTFGAADEDAAKRVARWLDARGQVPWQEVSASPPELLVSQLSDYPDDAA